MIKIKINGQNETIPTADELTVNQYIEFVKNKETNIIGYLSSVLGITYKESFYSKVSNSTYLKQRIGSINDYTKMLPVNKIIFKDGDYRFLKDLDISTIGERWTIEENGKNLKDEELLCFVLAVLLTKDSMNLEKVNEMKEKLMNEPYKNVLPTAFFLLRRFSIGNDIEESFLKKPIFLIKMSLLKSKLVLIILENILTILRYKLYARY